MPLEQFLDLRQGEQLERCLAPVEDVAEARGEHDRLLVQLLDDVRVREQVAAGGLDRTAWSSETTAARPSPSTRRTPWSASRSGTSRGRVTP